MTTMLLLHSPLVGPSVWGPLADALKDRGLDVRLPDLRPTLDAAPPYWRAWADRAAAAARDARGDIVLVGHSGAGRLLPAATTAMERPAAAYAFVDAGLPYDGESHMTRAPAAFRAQVTALTEADGRLAPWTSWWGEEALAALVPSRDQREALASDCPRVPAGLLDEPIPVPAAWPDAPCVYLAFTYQDEASGAAARGWPVDRIPGGHLQMLVDPARVADALLGLLRSAGLARG